jgi:hypothetical protein
MAESPVLFPGSQWLGLDILRLGYGLVSGPFSKVLQLILGLLPAKPHTNLCVQTYA